ncbi:MAG TPA: glycosyltransferase [Vicinamibacterales bacterium]|nr:glycosyltransferase [Vicinamibacterales bacterium]
MTPLPGALDTHAAPPAVRPAGPGRVGPGTVGRATVGVVITTYNHARFLEDALASVRRQTRPCDTIVVVDDGSSDDPAAAVAAFPDVRLIRQENRGLAGARNRGVAALDTTYVVFLDADDRLAPPAIERGLACFGRAPDCGFVYGGHLYIDGEGREIGGRYEPPGDEPYLKLLRGNFVAMHGTVMYRRERLLEAGGFDETLRRCEDYDLYLRMARRFPVAGYADLVAEYRLHGGNMSADHVAMLHSALDVHARHLPPRQDTRARTAWRDGRRGWRRVYAEEMAAARYRDRQRGGSLLGSLPALLDTARARPSLALHEASRGLRHRLARLLPARLGDRVLPPADRRPPLGRVRFGDLRRVTPISPDFGFDRGLPVDRYYIEKFLARHASEIAGRVLEVGDDSYTRRFGGVRVTRADILHVHAGNPRATFVGDLTDPSVLPENTFDCIVLTQTLHLIYDVRLAIDRLRRALAPGGVLLVTAPGISAIDRGEWGSTWFWSFTAVSMRRLFGEVFGEAAVMLEEYGNVLSATAFLQGLAVEELTRDDLAPLDHAYPVILGVRARKETRA